MEELFNPRAGLRRTTDEQLIANLVGSSEYFTNHQSDNLTFLQGAYNDTLGRKLDSSGQASWLPYLNAGGSRTFVATQLVTSSEYRTNLIAGYYTTYLGHTGSSTDIAGWVNHLADGMTDEQVLVFFLTTADYFLKAHAYP